MSGGVGPEREAAEVTEAVDLEAFDRMVEAYHRRVLGWEFDLLELEQQADEEMRS